MRGTNDNHHAIISCYRCASINRTVPENSSAIGVEIAIIDELLLSLFGWTYPAEAASPCRVSALDS